jgi:DNA-binding transcriptional ArsR family regulator
MNGSLDLTYSALADKTRRAIITQLADADAVVSHIASPHDMTLTGVMKHLHVLERAGLIRREKRGREVWCRLNPAPLQDAADWASRYRAFWEARFDALAAQLEPEQARRKSGKRPSRPSDERLRGGKA